MVGQRYYCAKNNTLAMFLNGDGLALHVLGSQPYATHLIMARRNQMRNPIVTSSMAATWAMLRKRQELSAAIEHMMDLLVSLSGTQSDELG
jgi:maleate cis-trans isomerase